MNVFPTVDSLKDTIDVWKNFLLINGRFIYLLAYFAFTFNLSREIIKDMEDMEGDKLIYAKTLPLTVGIKKSLWIAIFILLSAPIFFTLFFFIQVQKDLVFHILALLPLGISSILNLISIAYLLKKDVEKQTLKKADLFIKIAMLSGVLIPFYWWFLLMY
jgi:4-hydroxybenzoate polyprenyltransferase